MNTLIKFCACIILNLYKSGRMWLTYGKKIQNYNHEIQNNKCLIKYQVIIDTNVNTMRIWTYELNNVQVLSIKCSQIFKRMIDTTFYTTQKKLRSPRRPTWMNCLFIPLLDLCPLDLHNTIYLQVLQKTKKNQAKMEGFMIFSLTILPLWVHLSKAIKHLLKNTNAYMKNLIKRSYNIQCSYFKIFRFKYWWSFIYYNNLAIASCIFMASSSKS